MEGRGPKAKAPAAFVGPIFGELRRYLSPKRRKNDEHVVKLKVRSLPPGKGEGGARQMTSGGWGVEATEGTWRGDQIEAQA